MNVLQEIVAAKRQELAEAKIRTPLVDLERRLDAAPPVRDFVPALLARGPVALIAEIKRASPSAGLIRPDFDPVAIAREYENAGAAALSVLTDEPYFMGRLEYLSAIRCSVNLPVLRKDFILDPYQVVEARVAGADCVLLIAECLADHELAGLYHSIRELGMEALIELYDTENLERVLALEPRLIGVNNRNLRTMVTDLGHSLQLKTRIPDSICFVSESGIQTADDVERLRQAGVQAMLVGESLMKQPDLTKAVSALLQPAGDLHTDG